MTDAPRYGHGPLWMPEGILFRLWAPSAQSVILLLNEKAMPMKDTGEGWYEYLDFRARGGDLYEFLIDGTHKVPDPASRFQPDGVAGASQLIEPGQYAWGAWQNRPWEEAIIYELHVGCFTPEGTYAAAGKKLGYLAEVGITAIELMPVAAFAGMRGWGYDGVFPYAPHAAYGTPEELQLFIDTAHRHGLMVFLDVVYNHFGPSGNFLNEYAKEFFTDEFKTPWGSAIRMQSPAVRDFYIDNALYWLNEYNFDGLRFDAVHAINDPSEKHILYEIAERVREKNPDKHLILENDSNEVRYLKRNEKQMPVYFTAQWNDDLHHCLHVLLTGETDSYYQDYKAEPLHKLARCLTQGFDYQGEISPHRGKPRGEKSGDLPPQAFVSFLQNHDQIGNRALGDRLTTLAPKEKHILGMTLLLLSPQPPLLFMGEEWGTQKPFLYFCDFEGELAEKVREGRRNEFQAFSAFTDPAMRAKIPDPNAESTFDASRLDWHELEAEAHIGQAAFTMRMLELRRRHILPLLKTQWTGSEYQIENGALQLRWRFGGRVLSMFANFSDAPAKNIHTPNATHIWGVTGDAVPPWHSVWRIENAHD